MTVQQILNKAEMLVIRQLNQREKPINLTNDDKFALAFVSGVHLFFKNKCNMPADVMPYFEKYVYEVITEPCGIAWDGNEFRVFTQNE